MIIYLYGPEEFLVRKKIRELVNEYKKKYPAGLNIFRFDQKNFNQKEFEDCLKIDSLFGGKKLVILEDIKLDILSDKNLDAIFVIWHEKPSPDILGRADFSQEFPKLENKERINVFGAVDKLAEKNKKLALRLFQELISRGENEIHLFSMVVSKWRNLIKVSASGGSASGGKSLVKMHPYALKKAKQQAEKYSLEDLKQHYKLLADLDFQIKTGQKDSRFALDYFVLKL